MTALPKNGKAYSTGELPIYILSAELTTNGKVQNLSDTKELQGKLEKHFGPTFVKPVIGCYAGHEEKSFVVNAHQDEETILELAAYFGQESVLRVDTHRNCELIYILPHQGSYPREDIGKLKNVEKFEALNNGSWTYDRLHGEWFIIV